MATASLKKGIDKNQKMSDYSLNKAKRRNIFINT